QTLAPPATHASRAAAPPGAAPGLPAERRSVEGHRFLAPPISNVLGSESRRPERFRGSRVGHGTFRPPDTLNQRETTQTLIGGFAYGDTTCDSRSRFHRHRHSYRRAAGTR